MPEKLEKIGNSAFSCCSNLKTIEIPEGIKIIGDYAFSEAPITEINFPESLCKIGTYVFSQSSISTIVIPESVEVIEGPFKEGGLFIFCEASEKPSGWADGWDFNCTVKWNVSVVDIVNIGGVIYAITENYAIIASPPADDGGYPSEVEYKGKKYTVIS